MMVVYADILFAINFSMDFFSLFVCSLILHRKVSKKRIIIASLIGALYGVLDVILINNELLSVITCIIISIILTLIAFYTKNIKNIIIAVIMFWGVSAGLGGLMSIIYSFLNRLFGEILETHSKSEAYNGARFFIIASITAVTSMIFSRIFTSKKDIKECKIKIIYEGKEFNISSLCDSGNVLVEPLSGKPVILVSQYIDLGKIIQAKDDKFKRYIPFTDVSGKGIIKGVVPEKILINNTLVSAVVATIDKKSFDGYDALVPSSLL